MKVVIKQWMNKDGCIVSTPEQATIALCLASDCGLAYPVEISRIPSGLLFIEAEIEV
jgi:hypothetical protein